MTSQEIHAFCERYARAVERSDVAALEGDKICKETRLYDFTGMLVQLGILKAKAS